MEVKDILKVVERYPKEFRLRNLATTQTEEEHPVDRLVVELIPYIKGHHKDYGCFIDRKSNVTIVSTSSVAEHGTGYFAYYLALFGNFNYISKEYNEHTDNPISYYTIENENEGNLGEFLSDIRSLSKGDDKWVIFILSCESKRTNHFNFIHNVRPSLNIQKTTVIQEDTFLHLYKNIEQMLAKNYRYSSELDGFYPPVGKKNIALHLNAGVELNAFTLRVVWKITALNSDVIPLIRDISKVVKEKCEPDKPWLENEKWKEKGFGYLDI